MKKTLKTEKVPIKLWLDDIEAGALDQAKNLANLPFVFHHVAIMPDAHQGYGMPIGGVMATEGVIVPNAVGVDIGCGMCAVPTDLKNLEPADLKKVMAGVRNLIPLGFNHHKTPRDESWMPVVHGKLPLVEQEYRNARAQVGTLGGGNHFIEIQRGSDCRVWLMIHSGSRNIGFRVANHYNQLAIEISQKAKSPIPKEWQLAHLDLATQAGQTYLAEMEYCVEFALRNRLLMLAMVEEALIEQMGEVEFGEVINIAHNYAAPEKHFGREVLVHRKGATSAAENQLGIIPGSQGSKSYIVRGLGNPESFRSCSHGAGRLMGRKEAQRSLDLEKEKARLDRLGVIHALRSRRGLDEAAGAYKDITTVIAAQTDLVEVVVELTPLAVIKG
jgi:tRNA-splicing ligase RtcB